MNWTSLNKDRAVHLPPPPKLPIPWEALVETLSNSDLKCSQRSGNEYMVVRFLMSKFYEELMTKWRCHSNQACDSSSLLSYFKDFTVALSQWQGLSVLSTSVSIAVFLTDQYPSLPHCIFFLWGAFVLCNPFKSSCFVHEKWNRGFDKTMSIFLKWVNFQIYFSYEFRIVASV